MNNSLDHSHLGDPNPTNFYGLHPVAPDSSFCNNEFNADYNNFDAGFSLHAPQAIRVADPSADSSASFSSSTDQSLQVADVRPLSFPTDNTDHTQNLLDSSIFNVTSTATTIRTQQISPSAYIPLSVWLNQSFEGRNLISLYNSQHNFVFTSTNRNELVRLVLDREYDKLPQIPAVEPSRFVRIRNEILEIFPRELPGTYYTPHVKKTQHSKGIPAKGKLLSQHNFRKGKQKKKAAVLLPPPTQSVTASSTIDSTTQEQLDFLSKNLEPWSEVVSNWESTHDVRQQTLKSLNDIQVHFDKFPCLKQPRGYQLLESDFNKLYPNKAKNLSDNWPTFRTCIIELLRNSREPKTDAVKVVVSKFSTLKGDALDTAVLWVLSSMIKRSTPLIHADVVGDRPKKGRKRKIVETENSKESPWNPTAAEVQRGFLFHVTTLNNKEESIEGAKEFMREKRYNFNLDQ